MDRDFNAYPLWIEGAGSSHIEDGKSGDTVGAIRNAPSMTGMSASACSSIPTLSGP